MRISTKCSKQLGASALETSFAVIPVLLVCLLGIELIHAHQHKQLVSLALHEAGRQASVAAADHHKVERAFALALSPLFAPAGQHASPLDRQKATIARYRQRYALPLWQLELTDVKIGSAKSHGYRTVRLDLIYLHEPLQSWLRQALRQTKLWLGTRPDGLAQKAQQQGLIAIRLSRSVVIHSREVKRGPKMWLEDDKQARAQTLHGQPNLMKGLPPQPQAVLKDLQATMPSSRNGSAEVSRRHGETLAQTLFDSRPKDTFNPTRDSAGRAKTSTSVLLTQDPKKQDLCGVLLCCLPEQGSHD
jgi:hypothetical protein